METLKTKISNELTAYKDLLRAVPGPLTAAFVLGCVLMNLFANKSLDFGISWLVADGGLILSWAAFLTNDIIVKRFGAKASVRMTVFGLFCNLVVAGIFALLGNFPGLWGEFFSYEAEEVSMAVNNSLNATMSGTWYILLGSSVAFLVSGIANAFINAGLRRLFKNHDSFFEYSFRSYVSTFLAQFIDNMVFSMIVSMNFFGWTWGQAVIAAALGGILELLMEVVFSPIGFVLVRKWKRENVGLSYITKYAPEMLEEETSTSVVG